MAGGGGGYFKCRIGIPPRNPYGSASGSVIRPPEVVIPAPPLPPPKHEPYEPLPPNVLPICENNSNTILKKKQFFFFFFFFFFKFNKKEGEQGAGNREEIVK